MFTPARVCPYIERSDDNLKSRGPGTYRVGQASWPVNPKNLPVSGSPVMGFQVSHHVHPALLREVSGLN